MQFPLAECNPTWGFCSTMEPCEASISDHVETVIPLSTVTGEHENSVNRHGFLQRRPQGQQVLCSHYLLHISKSTSLIIYPCAATKCQHRLRETIHICYSLYLHSKRQTCHLETLPQALQDGCTNHTAQVLAYQQ